VKVYQVLLIYQHLSLSGYQVLLQQSQEAYSVLEFLEMFLTHDPTQPTKMLKNLDPTQSNPTQPVGGPNPWTTLLWCTESLLDTVGMLYMGYRIFVADRVRMGTSTGGGGLGRGQTPQR